MPIAAIHITNTVAHTIGTAVVPDLVGVAEFFAAKSNSAEK